MIFQFKCDVVCFVLSSTDAKERQRTLEGKNPNCKKVKYISEPFFDHDGQQGYRHMIGVMEEGSG